MLQNLKNSKKAFTLVEMLIVVVIIGILSSALIPRLQGAQARARDTARTADLNQVSAALTTKFSDTGVYPGTGNDESNYTLNLSDIRSEIIPRYLDSIPSDPQSQRPIEVFSDGSSDGSTSDPGENGQYAYMPVKRGGASEAGAILGANVEDLSSANWVASSDVGNLSSEHDVGGATDGGSYIYADWELNDIESVIGDCDGSVGMVDDSTYSDPTISTDGCYIANDVEAVHLNTM